MPSYKTTHNSAYLFLDNVHRMFDRAVGHMTIDPGLAKLIRQCSMLLHFQFPIRVDGKYRVIQAFRAHHSHHRVPAKGGSRFSSNINQDEVVALART